VALVSGGGSVAHGAVSGGGFGPAAASFLNGRQGWVLGRSGCESCARLFATADGGVRWTVMPRLPVRLGFLVPARTSVTGLYFADPRNGYLFDPGLELTHDGGRTWTQGPLPRLAQLTGGAGFAYALHETAGGSVRVWRNAAGSNRWVAVPLPHDGDFPAPAGSQGFQLAVEGATLMLLRLGPSDLPDPSTTDLGALWMSTDEGSTWLKRTMPCTWRDGGASVLGSELQHPKAWLLDCYDNEQSSQEQHTQHHLYGSTDQGMTWTRLGDPSHVGSPALLAGDGSGSAVFTTESGSSDQLHFSADGGRGWSTLFASGGGDFGWADLAFVSAATGFVVGPTHYAPEHLYRTDNGGRSWRILPVN
jgi:photosystem II stability/assembly factor-like uncharacterized protein